MKRHRKTFSTLVLCTLLLSTTMLASAEEVSQWQQQLQDISRRMQEQLGSVKVIKQKVNTVSGQLEEIEEQLDQEQGELHTVESKLLASQRKVEENTKAIQRAEEQIAERSQILKKRIRDIYINGQISYLDVLFGATDFSDLVSRYDLLQRILNADSKLIEKVKSDRELAQQKKVELEREMVAVQELQKRALEKRNLVASRYQAKRDVLGKLESEQEEAQRAYNELLEASNRIERMLRNRSSSSSGSTAGKLATGSYMWPTDGTVTSNFGWRTHPVFGNKRLHAGTDIGADYGDPIVAADGGVVVSSGWISGYGKTVIIEHNGTYSTLYAHAQELLVAEGQTIRKGQLIARVGDTGYTTGPNVHFEVRVNGAPQNPLDYLS